MKDCEFGTRLQMWIATEPLLKDCEFGTRLQMWIATEPLLTKPGNQISLHFTELFGMLKHRRLAKPVSVAVSRILLIIRVAE
ncbi:MAG: hypothetical protein JRI39_07040 [Deltaproteobacteria bacterium]|nr:hypothetical protein [Deltaproteobacteria bacterium]